MKVRQVSAALWVLLSGVGCGPLPFAQKDAGPTAEIHVLFDPTMAHSGNGARAWVSFPFPSDFRRVAGGMTRWDDFPDPDVNASLAIFTSHAQDVLDGWGTQSGIYFAFDGPVDVDALPGDPLAYLDASAPLQLVDVTAGSPDYGRRRPLRVEYFGEDGKFVAANTVAAGPAWGHPLQEETTYALIATDTLLGGGGAVARAPELLRRLLGLPVSGDKLPEVLSQPQLDELTEVYAPLRTWLAGSDIGAERVVAATVFTTQRITAQLRAIRTQVRDELPPASPEPDGWKPLGGPGTYFKNASFQAYSGVPAINYHIYEGVFLSPNYQEGMPPYARGEGAFHFVDGRPEPAWMEPLTFVLSVPDIALGPGECHPIVQISHGTGGDAYSAVDDGTAGRLAARGMAAFGIAQPSQGDRGTLDQVSLALNPSASRSLIRQSAVDVFSVVWMIEAGTLSVPANRSATGTRLCFRIDRQLFFGHSQGGLTASLAAALEDRVVSWMISGAGGGTSITALEPTSVNNMVNLLRMFLEMEDYDEPLTDLHPVMTLVQALSDITDPNNYALHWSDHAQPANILMTSGRDDVFTPARSAEAMARTAGIPIVRPLVVDIPDLQQTSAPVTANLRGTATRGFLQWQADHYPVFHWPEAINASMRFLESSAYSGTAVIERNPSSGAL